LVGRGAIGVFSAMLGKHKYLVGGVQGGNGSDLTSRTHWREESHRLIVDPREVRSGMNEAGRRGKSAYARTRGNETMSS
jgi:hypothetical protein